MLELSREGAFVTAEKQGNYSRPKGKPRGRPWQKGVSGNPNGRKTKDFTLTSLLKEELDKIPQGEKQGRTWRQLLVLAWLTGALKQPALLFELLNRLEGRPVQPIQLDIRREVERIAEESGLDPNTVLVEANRILKASG